MGRKSTRHRHNYNRTLMCGMRPIFVYADDAAPFGSFTGSLFACEGAFRINGVSRVFGVFGGTRDILGKLGPGV